MRYPVHGKVLFSIYVLHRGTTNDLLPLKMHPFQMGCTLKGKNLLLEEQILSFKSCMTPTEKGGKTKQMAIASLEVYLNIMKSETNLCLIVAAIYIA